MTLKIDGALLRHDAPAWQKDGVLKFAQPPRAAADELTFQASAHAQQRNDYLEGDDTEPTLIDARQLLSDYRSLPAAAKRGFNALAPALQACHSKLPYGRIKPNLLARERGFEALDLDLGQAARRTRTTADDYDPRSLDGHEHYVYYSREGAEKVNGILRLSTGRPDNFGVRKATIFSSERRVPPTMQEISQELEERVPAIDAHLNYARKNGHAFDGVTFRGISKHNAEMLKVADLQEGNIVREASYYSTSTDLNIAKNDFAKNDGTLMYVVGTSGVRKPNSGPIKDEHEVLYPRETAFQVVKNTEFPNGREMNGVRIQRIVVLKELPHEDTPPPFVHKTAKQTFLDYVFPEVAVTRFEHAEQCGSTPGGFYELPSGERGYAKFYQDPKQAQIEAFADALYSYTATAVPKARLLTIEGQPALFRSLINGRPATAATLHDDLSFKEHFALDAMLANHDVLGTNIENIIQDENGRHFRIDNGSALMFRACGAHTSVNADSVPELLTMRDPRHSAGQIFSSLSDDDVAQQIYTLRDRYFRRPDGYGRTDVRDMAEDAGLVGDDQRQVFDLFERRLTAAIKWADDVKAKAVSQKPNTARPVVSEAEVPKAPIPVVKTSRPVKAAPPVPPSKQVRNVAPDASTPSAPKAPASDNSSKSDSQNIAMWLALVGATGLTGLGGYYLYKQYHQKQPTSSAA